MSAPTHTRTLIEKPMSMIQEVDEPAPSASDSDSDYPSDRKTGILLRVLVWLFRSLNSISIRYTAPRSTHSVVFVENSVKITLHEL